MSYPFNIDIERTEIPDHLLENLSDEARFRIEEKLYKLDVEVAKHEQLIQQTTDTKSELHGKLSALRRDAAEFEKMSQEEIQELKDYQEAELKKIKKEKKEFSSKLTHFHYSSLFTIFLK